MLSVACSAAAGTPSALPTVAPPALPPPTAPEPPTRASLPPTDQAAPAQSAAAAGPGQPIGGRIIRISGRIVQIPPDAYVSRELNLLQCPSSTACPEVPMYELVRGGSTATVGGQSGTIYQQEIAPGEEGAFDFLRR